MKRKRRRGKGKRREIGVKEDREKEVYKRKKTEKRDRKGIRKGKKR